MEFGTRLDTHQVFFLISLMQETERILISDDTKSGEIVNTLEDRKKIQNDIDKLGKQAKNDKGN